MSAVVKLPPVDRIEDLQLHDSVSTDQSTHRVEIQYTARTPSGQVWHSLQVPLLDAMYLLNMLEALAQDHGFDHLRHPPGGPN